MRTSARTGGLPGLAGRYPGVAVVAGASEGLGAAFSRALAASGFPLLLVARRAGPLAELAADLTEEFGHSVRTLACDLSRPDAPRVIEDALEGDPIGVLVYNAAYAPGGPFAQLDESDIDLVVGVNVRTPMRMIHGLLRGHSPEAGTRRAAVIVSSMSGWQGGPFLSAYAASKAFLRVLGEGLWDELRPGGVDVVVSVPGATDTPGYRARSGSTGPKAGVLSPAVVARAALRRLGRGPLSVPGAFYKFSVFVMGRLLPRSLAVRVMGAAGRGLER